MSERKKKLRRTRPHKPPGTSPGTLIVDPHAAPPRLSVIAYGPSGLVEKTISDPHDVCPLLESHDVVWLDVDGLGDVDVIRRIGTAFGLHRLALEDVLDVRKRAKVDRFGTHHYIVAVMVALTRAEGIATTPPVNAAGLNEPAHRDAHAPSEPLQLETEQLSMFLGKKFVITFQERPGDSFDRVRERIRGGQGMIRTGGSGYLAYALLDATIDAYFPILEHYGECLEGLEDLLVQSPTAHRLPEIHTLKRDLLTLRRAIWPLREALNVMLRESSDAFTPETKPYLNDCYDHTVQIMDLVENHREMASGLMDVYLSSMSNRMNEIMKVLTIISTIFMPLTFIAGVYGMNFHPDAGPWSMPELTWRYGYVGCLALMLVSALAMLVYFRRKGWLGGPRRRP